MCVENVNQMFFPYCKDISVPGAIFTDNFSGYKGAVSGFFPRSQRACTGGITYSIIGIPEIICGVYEVIEIPVFDYGWSFGNRPFSVRSIFPSGTCRNTFPEGFRLNAHEVIIHLCHKDPVTIDQPDVV